MVQLNKKRLVLLNEACEKLIKILNIDELLMNILDIAKKGLDADRGTVYVVDRETNEIWSKVVIGDNLQEIRLPIGKGIAGSVAETGERINIKNAYADPRFNREIDKRTGYKTKTILCMPIQNQKNEIVGVFQILNKSGGKFQLDDEAFLTSLSNYSALALELAALHEELLHKQRIEQALVIAREVQVNLLPHSIPEIEGYEVFGNNITCEEVSGDYYDIYPIDENKWIFTICDVSGKGIPAALMMAGLQSHLKAIVRFNHCLPEIVAILNEYVIQNSTPDKYITFFIGILDEQIHTFEYVNAGHNPPVFLDRDKNIKLLKVGGPIIGMITGLTFVRETIQLEDGDFIFSYTDGVTEAFNKDNEEFGEERLYEFLKNHYDSNLSSLSEHLLDTLESFAAGASYGDDITLLMLKKK